MRLLWFAMLALVTASLSGCITSISDVEYGQGPLGDDVSLPGEVSVQVYRDLHLSGTVDACDIGYCLHVIASNEGDEDYHVHNICISSYSESMTRDGQHAHRFEPMAHCEAFGTTPMAPNTHLDYQAEWDGTIWSEENGTHDAPAGDYVWTVHFRAYQDAYGGDPVDLKVSFQVSIGA